MKTKRLKKLMMSMGLSRNQVNSMVQSQRTEGSNKVSNESYYVVLNWTLPTLDSEIKPYVKNFVVS